LRDVRPEDKENILSFCRNTWPGYGDFIPRAWDSWLRQRRGRFIVAELGNTPVGIAKVTDFGRGEVWLEGLRVDPRYRRRGIGNAINMEVARTLNRMRPQHIRFCTAQTNRASRRIGTKYGFDLVARFRNYWGKARRGKPRGDFADPSQIAEVHDFMRESRFIKLSSGLIAEGWIFRQFSRRLLSGYIRAGKVVILRKAGGIRGVGIYPLESYDDCLDLGFVDGDDRAVETLIRNCFYLARQMDLPYCSASVPTRRFAGLAEQAGFERKDSIGQVVFEHTGSGIGPPHSRRKA
jgi:ribosomal protein S18 acetylase RimI-like enzyme